MASKTTNYGLNKHSPQDFYNVEARNENWDKIDEALAAADPTKITAKAAPADGDGVMIADSADGSKAKRLLWSSVKTALGKLFVPLARKINGKVLTEDVTLTGENIAVSSTDSTLISGAVKYRINPNLLDNWYFGNPVNQRNGYYIPAGVKYNTLSWTEAGTTDKAYPVIGYSGQDPLITVNGTNYIVGKSAQVPGYCDGSSYTIDRWSTEGNIVVTVESDGISIENVGDEAGQFKQELPSDFCPDGTLVCISAIVKSASGDARLFLSESHSPWGHPVDFIPLQTGLFSGSGNLMSGNHKFSIYLGAGAKTKLTAVKLELGDTQTLAHQDSSGNWILNEIPDFEEQLKRCEFYRRVSDSGHYFSGAIYSDSNGVFLFPFSGGMRVTPSIEIVLPGAIIDSNGARRDLSTDNYSIESVDRFGAKIVLYGLSGISFGLACIVDAKFALSADL